MIHIENLKKYYGDFAAVKGISFDVAKGEILGFLGPNGAGKTTTMKVITGYYGPDEGVVTVDGLSVTENSLETRQRIGYLPESNPLYLDLKVWEYLEHVAEMRQIPKERRSERIRAMAELTGLEQRLNQPIHQLSKGYRQRVGLAQAMLHDPKVLILDEPTIGLDPNQIVEIRQLIKRIGEEKTVILSTHILPEVQATCDRVVIIHEGEVMADGTLGELQHHFQGRPVIDIDVSGSGASDLSAWQSVAGVEAVEERPAASEGVTSLRIATGREADPRAELFRLAVDRGWTLLTLNRQVQSLENIFAQLTRKDAAATAEEEAA